jgi:hypothetical protein
VKKNYGIKASEDECEAICEGIAAHKILKF